MFRVGSVLRLFLGPARGHIHSILFGGSILPLFLVPREGTFIHFSPAACCSYHSGAVPAAEGIHDDSRPSLTLRFLSHLACCSRSITYHSELYLQPREYMMTPVMPIPLDPLPSK